MTTRRPKGISERIGSRHHLPIYRPPHPIGYRTTVVGKGDRTPCTDAQSRKAEIRIVVSDIERSLPGITGATPFRAGRRELHGIIAFRGIRMRWAHNRRARPVAKIPGIAQRTGSRGRVAELYRVAHITKNSLAGAKSHVQCREILHDIRPGDT